MQRYPVFRKRKRSYFRPGRVISERLLERIQQLDLDDKLKQRAVLILSIIQQHISFQEQRHEVKTKTGKTRTIIVKPGESWISRYTIQDRLRTVKMNLTIRQIQHVLDLLVKNGIIERREATGGVSRGHYGCIYRIPEKYLVSENNVSTDFFLYYEPGDFKINEFYVDLAEKRNAQRITVKKEDLPFELLFDNAKFKLFTPFLRNHSKREKADLFYASEIVIDFDMDFYWTPRFVDKRVAKFARRFRRLYGGKIDIYYTGSSGFHMHITQSVLNKVYFEDPFVLKEAIKRLAEGLKLDKYIDMATLSPKQIVLRRDVCHDVTGEPKSWMSGLKKLKKANPAFLSMFDVACRLAQRIPAESPAFQKREFKKVSKGKVDPWRTYRKVEKGLAEGEPWSLLRRGRDTAAFCMACDMYEAGFSDQLVFDVLKNWNMRNRAPLSERILREKMRSAKKFLRRKGKLSFETTIISEKSAVLC